MTRPLSYLGGDMNSQKDVGKFLRNDLAPLLKEYGCAAIIIHHTNKVSTNPDRNLMDPTYLGAGECGMDKLVKGDAGVAQDGCNEHV
ncbi:MAG: hypothetical protein WDM76_04840 [Limisphaerales bacterium]